MWLVTAARPSSVPYVTLSLLVVDGDCVGISNLLEVLDSD